MPRGPCGSCGTKGGLVEACAGLMMCYPCRLVEADRAKAAAAEAAKAEALLRAEAAEAAEAEARSRARAAENLFRLARVAPVVKEQLGGLSLEEWKHWLELVRAAAVVGKPSKTVLAVIDGLVKEASAGRPEVGFVTSKSRKGMRAQAMRNAIICVCEMRQAPVDAKDLLDKMAKFYPTGSTFAACNSGRGFDPETETCIFAASARQRLDCYGRFPDDHPCKPAPNDKIVREVEDHDDLEMVMDFTRGRHYIVPKGTEIHVVEITGSNHNGVFPVFDGKIVRLLEDVQLFPHTSISVWKHGEPKSTVRLGEDLLRHSTLPGHLLLSAIVWNALNQ